MNQASDVCNDATDLKFYDKDIPSRHCYLSHHLSSSTSIGRSFKVGQIVELALFAFHNITLFPGQLLPFCVAEFTDIDVEIEQFLSGEQSIGIVSCNQIIEEQNDRPIEALSIYGVTADVQSFQISSDNCLVGLLIGRQKFYTVNISQNEGQIFATGKVQILHDPQDSSSTGTTT